MVLLPLQAPPGQPPRVISISVRAPTTRQSLEDRIVKNVAAHIEDFILFDIGFGIPADLHGLEQD
jgi:hypothetical protein